MTQKPFAYAYNNHRSSIVAFLMAAPLPRFISSRILFEMWSVWLLSRAINYGWVIYCYHPFICGHLSLLWWNIWILHVDMMETMPATHCLASFECVQSFRIHIFHMLCEFLLFLLKHLLLYCALVRFQFN